MNEELFGCYNDGSNCKHKGHGIDPKNWKGANNWCLKDGKCKNKRRIE